MKSDAWRAEVVGENIYVYHLFCVGNRRAYVSLVVRQFEWWSVSDRKGFLRGVISELKSRAYRFAEQNT